MNEAGRVKVPKVETKYFFVQWQNIQLHFFLFSIFREIRNYVIMGVEVQCRVALSVDLQGNTKKHN